MVKIIFGHPLLLFEIIDLLINSTIERVVFSSSIVIKNQYAIIFVGRYFFRLGEVL